MGEKPNYMERVSVSAYTKFYSTTLIKQSLQVKIIMRLTNQTTLYSETYVFKTPWDQPKVF